MYAQLPSRVQVFVILLTIAHQGPLSMESSRQRRCSGLQYYVSVDLLNPRA